MINPFKFIPQYLCRTNDHWYGGHYKDLYSEEEVYEILRNKICNFRDKDNEYILSEIKSNNYSISVLRHVRICLLCNTIAEYCIERFIKDYLKSEKEKYELDITINSIINKYKHKQNYLPLPKKIPNIPSNIVSPRDPNKLVKEIEILCCNHAIFEDKKSGDKINVICPAIDYRYEWEHLIKICKFLKSDIPNDGFHKDCPLKRKEDRI